MFCNKDSHHDGIHSHNGHWQRQSFFTQACSLSIQQKKGAPFFQAKLRIGQSNDKYEQEAESVANTVVNNPSSAPVVQQKRIRSIQRMCLECEEENSKGVQKMRPEKKEEELVQSKGEGTSATASASLSSRIESSRGKGNALPLKTQAEMQSSFGADFSNVNIHTDAEAVQMSKELQAQAFTHGSDIYFNSGKFSPESLEGKHLLAHELTHTVQQASSSEVMRDHNEAEIIDPVYENLRNYFRSEDLQGAIRLISTMNSDQKNSILSSSEFRELAARGSTGGADFGDESITQLLEAFLTNGYQNLYRCLNWMFYEFDADDDNNERFLRIIRRHSNESQKKFVRAWMKDQFIEYVGDRGMTDIVKLLGGPLSEKLLWIKDEGVDSWDMVYEVIMDHLSKQSISKEDSSTIFSNPQGRGDMRWYFGREIDVGDSTMVRLVDLLGFELYQKLDWMIYEDTNLSLVLNVIGSSPQPEIKEVLEREWLLIQLQQSIGESDYSSALAAMRHAAGLSEKPGQPLNISILDSTITQEFPSDYSSEPYEKLYNHGMFLVESAKDQLRIAVSNPDLGQNIKEWWAYDINYLEGFLKMHHQFMEAESEAENISEGEIEQMASNTAKGTSGTVQASFIQASLGWFRPMVRGWFRGVRGGVRGGLRTTRLSPPEVSAPTIARPPTFPSGSGSFPAQGISNLARIMNFARGALRYPVPPVSPPLAPTEPTQTPEETPKNSYSRNEWQQEAGRRLKAMRRQIEDMKLSRSTSPTTETEPDKEQQAEQEKRRRKLCYRLSIVLRRAGSGFVVENMGAMTPDDLRIPACRERTITGTTDFDFMLRNIAVGRFLVDGTYRTIATPNPEGNYHSEDEMFRLANEQFGSGNYTLDALFTERRPCNRCAPMITRFPLTDTFRVYCIINNDYNWTQIREHYNNGELF